MKEKTLIIQSVVNRYNSGDVYKCYRMEGGEGDIEVYLTDYTLKITDKQMTFISENKPNDCRIDTKIIFPIKSKINNKGGYRMGHSAVRFYRKDFIVFYPNREGVCYILKS
jgi:hypothetical protein